MKFIMEKHINYDNHQDETKTMTHRYNKLPCDGDPWAPHNVLKFGANEKHQLNTDGPSNRQEAPVLTNLSEYH